MYAPGVDPSLWKRSTVDRTRANPVQQRLQNLLALRLTAGKSRYGRGIAKEAVASVRSGPTQVVDFYKLPVLQR